MSSILSTDEMLPAPWVHRDEHTLHDLLKDAYQRDVPLEVVVGSLGKLNGRKLARIRKLAAEGPPAEEVGLEPFAPPEVMPTAGPEPARPLVGGRGETP